MTTQPVARALWATLLAAAFIAAIGHVAVGVGQAPANEWNDGRLSPSAALAHGQPLYTPVESGTMLGNVYGPVTAFFYLPAVIGANSPATAIRLALILSLLSLVVVSVVWLRSIGAAFGDVVWALSAWVLYAQISDTLWPTLFTVHADVPAIALGLAACGVLAARTEHRPSPMRLGLAAVLFAAAVGSKQPMLLAPLAAACWLRITCDKRTAARFLLAVAVAAIGLLAITSQFVSLRDMVWNAVWVPSQHPWRGAGGWSALLQSVRDLAPRSAPAAALLTVGIVARGDLAARWSGMRSAPWLLPLLVACANVPLSLVGRAKIGGSMNTLTFATTFLMFAALIAIAAPPRTAVRRPYLRMAQAASALLFLALAGAPFALEDGRRAWADVARVERGFTFARDHPGEVYFPFHPMIGFFADGEAYHFSDAIYAREFAGVKVDPVHVRAHVPQRMRWIATARVWPDYVLRFFPECSAVVSVDGLEGWEVRECRPQEASWP